MTDMPIADACAAVRAMSDADFTAALKARAWREQSPIAERTPGDARLMTDAEFKAACAARSWRNSTPIPKG